MKSIEEKIAVMQAFAKGATIEALEHRAPTGRWGEFPNPQWNWTLYDYRVKREPMVVFVDKIAGDPVANFVGYAYLSSPTTRKSVKFVEVLED